MARSASEPSPGDGIQPGEGRADVASSSRAGQLAVGSVLDGKYRIEGLLGEGGMGAVWWAHHVQLDRPVAIKLLRPGDDRALLSERLKIEARAAARLVHPAIVRVFDIDTSEGGEPYIVMELLKGESMAALLDRGRLAGVHAVQLVLPIAEGLSVAHAEGVVHRDLKPHNVFLSEEGERLQPKLLDFGIAKLTSAATVSGSLTETGITVGSPDYMSPEQARGQNDIDYRADIWSFAVVLYEAVTGYVPFDGDNYNALMRAIVEKEARPVPLENGVDQALADLIHWGLSKERSARPQSIHEFGRELARWLIGHAVLEDVCGAPLGPKWITRVAQKSVPVIEGRSEPPLPAPLVARGDTLVSPRHPSVVAKEPSSFEISGHRPTSRPPRGDADSRSSWRWALVAAAAVLVAGVSWALRASAPASPPLPNAAAVSVPAGALVLSAPALRSEPSAPVVQIAPSAPSPSVELSGSPPTARDKVHSAPLGSASLKPRDGKLTSDAPKPAPAAKPAPDVHDETRELLQAY